MKKICTILILLLFTSVVYSQTLSDVKLNKWLCCNLDKAFTDIGKETGLKFNYNVEKFKEIDFTSHPINKSLELFLNQVCKTHKLKYYKDTSGVINIIERWQKTENERLETTKSYKGAATKSNFMLSGRIIDKNSRETLPYVNVTIKGDNVGTVSNVDGFFSLLKVPTDTSTIIFSYIGYQTKEIFLTPQTNIKKLEIELDVDVVNIDEVTVTADRQDVLQAGGNKVSMYKMSPKKLNTLPNLGEKDIFRSFQLMPGISAANENSSGLYIRGGTPDQVLVLYDGFSVYNVEHLFGFFSAFNSNAIKDVQLYKGGFNSKYGGRLAGVVEITGKEGNQKEFNACADISLMSVNGFVEFPIGEKISAIIAARRSWASPIYDKIFDRFTDDNEDTENPGMGNFGASTNQDTKSFFYDLNTKITFRPSDKDIIALSVYNGKDDLDNSISPDASNNGRGRNISMNMETKDLTNWGNTGASLKWSRQYTDKLYVNTLLSYSNYFSLRDRSTSGTFSRGEESANSINRGVKEDNNLKDYTAKSDFEYKLTKNNQLEFGLQATYNNIDYSYVQNDTTTVIDRSSDGIIYTAYLQDKISLLKGKLNMTAGLRYNYFTETNKNYFEPRFNFMFKLTDKLSLKGATGLYYQFAKRVIREDITQGSRDFWVLSDNDKLPVSSSAHYIAGFSYETKKYLFDVEGYYRTMGDITEYSLRIETERRSINYSENFFTGTGIAQGLDVLVQKKSGSLTGWLGYTIGRTTNNITEFGDYDYYAANDVTHEFKSVLTYKWRKWDFGASWIFTTGRPYTAPEGGYQLTLLDGTTADYINVSVKNGNRLPNYHRLDLSATYNFLLADKHPVSLGFSLFNVYNRANIWYKEYEIIDNEVIETPVYYLGITPNINLTIKLK